MTYPHTIDGCPEPEPPRQDSVWPLLVGWLVLLVFCGVVIWGLLR